MAVEKVIEVPLVDGVDAGLGGPVVRPKYWAQFAAFSTVAPAGGPGRVRVRATFTDQAAADAVCANPDVTVVA